MTTTVQVDLDLLLGHMKPGTPTNIRQLHEATGISRRRLTGLLEGGVHAGRLESREGRYLRTEYYVAGTAPAFPVIPELAPLTPPISIAASTVKGTIDAYAASLRRHRELAMLTRGPCAQ